MRLITESPEPSPDDELPWRTVTTTGKCSRESRIELGTRWASSNTVLKRQRAGYRGTSL